MTIIAGIDPGLKGGISCIDTEGEVWAEPLPHIGKEVDLHSILSALAPPDEVESVIVERLGIRPGQSAQSGATQGINWGRLIGGLEVAGYSIRLVRPQDWKTKVLRGTKKDKSDAIAFVSRAYPGVNLKPGKCRTPQDGLADAVCIAEYGRQLMNKGAA
ncbi:hypothetical protein L0636_01040 [Halomonas janggokensis]|uniref:Uncharacterized protein n=1 Tax=Vreelandella janggokensis TaxID=370767 RepID=A0ABT4IS30_9GAMM|nr:hypothetical protein [Halomonas janggokensis]MCZ0926473.1 hypothetical protein [Halomonas janggokensis]MCZ0929011.1 hypothetical protein [Halomonas janggokensis]